MATSSHRAAALSIGLSLAIGGCGDPFVDGDYLGQALFTLSGTIRVSDTYDGNLSSKIKVALLWYGASQIALRGDAAATSSFPARYDLEVYSRPAESAFRALPDSEGRYAVSRVVLYADSDDNGHLDAGEPLVGGTGDHLLAYFEQSGTSVLPGGAFDAGFRLMKFQSCEDRLTETSAAMMLPAELRNEVDLVIGDAQTDGLSDLDCDDLPDDYCQELLLAIQTDSDPGLVDEYQRVCEDDTQPREPENNDPVPDNNLSCDEPDAADGNTLEHCAMQRVEACRNDHLTGLDQLSRDQMLETLRAFSVCAGAAGPCPDDLRLWTRENAPQEYMECVFRLYDLSFEEPVDQPPPDNNAQNQQFCTELAQQIETTDNPDDRAQLQETYNRECL